MTKEQKGRLYHCEKIKPVIFIFSCLTFASVVLNSSMALASDDQLSTSLSNLNSNETNTFSTYNNTAFRIRIQYPSNWQNAEYFVSGVFVTQFVSPAENSSDKFSANVNLAVQRLPGNITTLDQYTNASDNLLSTAIPGFKIIKSNNSAVVGGILAVEKVFAAKQATLDKNLNAIPFDVKVMQLYMMKGDKAYVITYTAEASNYDNYLPIAQRMINSFEISSLLPTITGRASIG